MSEKLFDAIKKRDMEGVKRFMEEGGDLMQARSYEGHNPLHHAAVHDNKDATRLFLDHGLDVDQMDLKGHTALHLAQSPEVAKMLLDHGADVNAKTLNTWGNAVDERTPLHIHARHGEMSQLLIEHGADVNAQDSAGQTPLHDALGLFHGLWFTTSETAVQAMLDAKPDLTIQDHYGKTGVDYALEASRRLKRGPPHGYFENEQQMLKHQQNEQTSLSILTSLAQAGGLASEDALNLFREFSSDAERTQMLVNSGADVNARDKNGKTPLWSAGNAEVVRVLIDAGADVHARDGEGLTALEEHERWGNKGMRDVFLEALREREAKETKQHLEQVVMGQGSKVDGDAEEQVQVQKQRRKM